MATVQTTYTEDQPTAVAGMAANTQPRGVDSYRVNQSAGIGYGLAVRRDSSSDSEVNLGCTAGADPFTATHFLGVAKVDLAVPASPGNPDEVQNGDMIAVLHAGDIWVVVSAAVNAGDDVACDTTSGKFNTAVGSATNAVIPNAVFLSDQATADGLALLRLNAGSIRG